MAEGHAVGATKTDRRNAVEVRESNRARRETNPKRFVVVLIEFIASSWPRKFAKKPCAVNKRTPCVCPLPRIQDGHCLKLAFTTCREYTIAAISHLRMSFGLSGHLFAHYRGHCSKDFPPEDPQVRRDEHPETNSTQTASRTEHPELVVAPQ
jgi:hypothetical protein